MLVCLLFRILGKYGGQPALGAGLVLSRLPRDSILKATGSPAAREIQYSKVEQQDARHLASVMQFKPTAREGASQSPWQVGEVHWDVSSCRDVKV